MRAHAERFCVAFALILACAPAQAQTASPAAPASVSPIEVLRRSDAQLEQSPAQYGVALPPRFAGEGADRTLAPYFHAEGADDGVDRLPLEETTADVTVAGVIAHVRLRQVFRNDGSKPIEAIYVFGASTRAAVHDMRMKIGGRTIEARIERREAARAQYEQAKQEGKRASLLEQQRPNVFTTRVANVMPRDRIEVELEYSELIVPEDNVYELVIPGPVGPRYPGGADPIADQWIATPYLTEGKQEPWRYDVRVRLETGIALKDLRSPSHKVDVSWTSNAIADVRLAEPGGGTKDFILQYRLAGERIETGALAWRGEREGFFALIVEPPVSPAPEQIAAREYVFVVDVSGSMSGFPLDTAKVLMRDLLTRVRPTDHLNVVVFSGASAQLAPRSLPATKENVASAIRFVESQHGGGGTELMAALSTAYAIPRTGAHVARSVVLVTDGFVGVEARAFKFVRERLDDANLFAFGIGSSVNRGLIEGLARAGSGEPWVVTRPEEARPLAEKFRRAIEEPVLTDIAVAFRGVDAREVAPMKLPDLMARRPLVVFGKLGGDPKGVAEVSGWSGGRRWRQEVDFAAAETGDRLRSLRWLWARKWVELLEDQHHLTQAQEVQDAITDLGLAYRLVTPFTSFVAIDSVVANRTGETITVNQPVPLPQGVSNLAVGSGSIKGVLGGGTGEAFGVLGARGSGSVGGVGVGLGGLGTRGGGRGAGGYGSIDLGGRGKGVTRMVPGKTSVVGGLDKDVIARVVRRHQNEIKYCHEAALEKTPELSGKVAAMWVIDAAGAVSDASISESTLNDAEVEACMLARIKRWKFPAPTGGGIVTVNHVWVFAPPGDAEPAPSAPKAKPKKKAPAKGN